MEWTQWAFIAAVIAAVAGIGAVVWLNPDKYITKIYTNPLVLYGIGTGVMVVYAWFAGDHTFLEKAAFAGGTFLAVKYLGVAADFAGMFEPKPSAFITRLDVNMVVMVSYAFIILAGLLNFIGVKEFADAAVEAITGAIVAGVLVVGEIYMNKERANGDG